jgi:acetolactate decarboxylase
VYPFAVTRAELEQHTTMTIKLNRACLLGIVVLFGATAGCASRSTSHGSAFQYSTIDALLDGNYDGGMTFAQLSRHGDFGLGTFDTLDGEMIEIDGHVLQVRSDGHVYPMPGEAQTPFSVVTFFKPDASKTLRGALSYRQLQEQLDGMRGHIDGHAFAFKITGRFSHLRARSVPRQTPPYARLADVVKHQAVFDMNDVSGTLVGFWFPENLRHTNVPGYHFHFVTNDRSAGGHVLDLTLAEGKAQVQELLSVEIALPRRAPTTQPIPTSKPVGDREQEIESVEK